MAEHRQNAASAMTITATNRYLSCRELCERYGIAKPTLYRWIQRIGFPQPVQLGVRKVAWRESDILRWEAGRTVGVGTVGVNTERAERETRRAAG